MTVVTPPHAAAENAKVEAFSHAPYAEKINLNLLDLENQVRHGATSLTRAATRMAMNTAGEGIRVDIVMNRVDEDVLDELRDLGLFIQHVSETHRRISAVVDDIAVLYDVAELETVEMIMPEYGGATQSGSVDGRASAALFADMARTAMSLSGAGQTVGILSDSFARTGRVRDDSTTPAAGNSGLLRNSKPQQSGDLPLTVAIRRDDGGGGDEGAGMAELVHDIAPGAAIAFHTAFGGQAVFAEGITDMCTTAGSTVVVDDVLYFAEPMYQDGIVAQAAAGCVASGVPYFSAAGNQSNRGFRQVFRDINPADDLSTTPTGNDLHDWGGGDGFLDLTLPPASTVRVVLQWNQPFASVSPSNGAQVDLDLYITPAPDAAGLSTPIVSSIGQQGSTGNPRGDAIEIVSVSNVGSSPMSVYLAIEHHDGSQGMIPQDSTTPLEFRLVFFESNFRQTSIQGILDHTSAFGGPTMYGHAVAPGVASVAAVPWFDTQMFNPEFTPSAATDPEDFSSRGGAISVQFNASGAFVPRTSHEPDIAAVDGNNTTFFGFTLNLDGYEGEPDTFPNFFGTSAAAPNAAAVAALMREYHGALTPAEILAAMVNTAIDITGTRAAVGRDDVTGAGLIDANAAIGALQLGPEGTIDTPSANVDITTGQSVNFSGTGTSPDGHVPLSFFWDFDGGAVNSTQVGPGEVVFSRAGTFTVTLTVSDSQGNSDATPATLTVTVSDPAAVTPVNVSGGRGGGGGGGCTLDPNGSADFTLLIALSSILAYVAWRRRTGSPMC
jgi:PKD repeat protein